MSTIPPSIRRWLRLENAVVLIVSLALYAQFGGSWWLFLGLLLVPDVSILGYLAGPRVGALCYNLIHAYAGPLMLGTYAVWNAHDLMLSIALIWVAHIGMDRVLGYGLKLPDGFKTTHLGAIGQAEAADV